MDYKKFLLSIPLILPTKTSKCK